MSYQRVSQNGNVIENINGKFYINGVECKTGKLSIRKKIDIFFLIIFSGVFCFGAGFLTCLAFY